MIGLFRFQAVELNKAVRIGDKPSAPIQILAVTTAAPLAAPSAGPTTTTAVVTTVTAVATASTESTPITTTTPQAPVNPTPPVELPISPPTKIRQEPKLPEARAPIKKYYGRKRDGQNSSSDDDLSYEEADSTEKNK